MKFTNTDCVKYNHVQYKNGKCERYEGIATFIYKTPWEDLILKDWNFEFRHLCGLCNYLSDHIISSFNVDDCVEQMYSSLLFPVFTNGKYNEYDVYKH